MKKFIRALFWVVCLHLAAGAAAAATNTLTVAATVLSKSNCKFTIATSALNFGAIDPAGSTNASANTTVQFRCLGAAPMASFYIDHDSGLYGASPSSLRMRHATVASEFLPYSLALTPLNGTVPKNVPQTLTISGTVLAADYQSAYVGNYADSVTLTINP